MDWSRISELTLIEKLVAWRITLALKARRDPMNFETVRTLSAIEDVLARLELPLVVWQPAIAA
jgi:hypothetical protein